MVTMMIMTLLPSRACIRRVMSEEVMRSSSRSSSL